ncbi:MAG TPA: response regulator [Candidatus Acidoferrum sp.]|nr:response regulator [Candidatus Acidoferrum sp.]
MRTPLKALIVEDSPDDAALLVDALQQAGFDPQYKIACHEEDCRAGMTEKPDIIFSDYSLPQFSVKRGLELLRETGFDIPFIVVSGTIGEDRAVEILKAGATDCVLKDRMERLGPAVTRALDEARGRAERLTLEAQLREAQKMESIGQLAGGLAHDFNNILTVIQGHASLMLEDAALSGESKDSAEEISLAAERGASLTRQLLTFSRRQILQTRKLNLNDVVEGIIKMLRRILGEDIKLTFKVSNAAPILADGGMIEQVLMNLAINARDAMPKGGALKISTGIETIGQAFADQNPEASAGEFVYLEVADTGCGIAPENVSKIFEPFFTTKEVGKGTGLGLATVYGIVKQHRGWITLQTAVDRGTVFKIFIPAVSGRAEAVDVTTEETIRGGNETILVVEDQRPLRRLVCHVLEAYGYRVIEADSGNAALARSREHRGGIDLLLTDLAMPGGMTGRELAAALRGPHPKLRIVFTSGYSAETVGQDVRLREGFDFLQKPYAPRTLARCIRERLDSSRVI